MVRDGQIGETTESSIDGLPVRLPMIEIRTIGAGGGSIARLESGALRVGPVSAGAEPGPVCYQRGGTEPTVTDSNAALGRIDAEAFKTGGMELDVAAASTAVNQFIAQPLGYTATAAAAGILDVATANMAGAIRLSLFEKGADPVDFALAPFGGAAGLHACAVAQELGIKKIVFPANASTLSALGILQADLRYDLSESLLMPAVEESAEALAVAVQALKLEAAQLLAANGFVGDRQRIEFSCDMRYRGQAFELVTPWSQLSDDINLTIDGSALQQLVANFHALHEERFAHASPEDATEIVTVRAVGVGRFGQSEIQLQATSASTKVSADSARTRKLYLDGSECEVPCLHRDSLVPDGTALSGPLIVEESYTVLLLMTGWTVRVIDNGDLLCERADS